MTDNMTTKNATRESVYELGCYIFTRTEYGRHAIEWFHPDSNVWGLIGEFFWDAEVAEADLERLQRRNPNIEFRLIYNHPAAWTYIRPPKKVTA